MLNEVANVARHKMRLSWAETRVLLGIFRELLPVRPLTIDVHDAGVALAAHYSLSVHDAMIAASALDAGCDTLWSEDMQDGMVLDGRVRIINPFSVA